MTTKELITAEINRGNLAEAASMIVQAIKEGADLSGQNIGFAHALLLSASWKEVSALLPRGTNFFLSSGWLHSVASGRPLNAQGSPVPWFTYPAIQFIETILEPQWKVFEWGSGNSTLWWAANTSSVVAVEDNIQWHSEVSRQVPSNAKVLVAPSLEEYVGALTSCGADKYDVIVIDGSHRNACAKVALERLADTGIIIFDNSDATSNAEGVQFLNEQGLIRLDFWGLIPSYLYKNCTSVFMRNADRLRHLKSPTEQQSCTGMSCQQSIDRMQRGQ